MPPPSPEDRYLICAMEIDPAMSAVVRLTLQRIFFATNTRTTSTVYLSERQAAGHKLGDVVTLAALEAV